MVQQGSGWCTAGARVRRVLQLVRGAGGAGQLGDRPLPGGSPLQDLCLLLQGGQLHTHRRGRGAGIPIHFPSRFLKYSDVYKKFFFLTF